MTARYYIDASNPQGGPELRGGALELFNHRGPEAVIAGPAETGKTFACCHKLHLLLSKYTGAQAVVVRKVRDTVHGSVLATLRKYLGPDTPVRVRGGEKAEWFDYPNGSRLWVAGMDNPGKALSTDRDFVYVNQAEELTAEDWEVLTTRATGRAGNAPYGQVMADCNPGPPWHWIRTRKAVRLFESRHEDNPTLHDGRGWTERGKRTLAALDSLTGVRKERLRYGRWAAAEGSVYEFDPRRHRLTFGELVDRQILQPDGRPGLACKFAVAGVDWGYTAPGVLGVWLGDGDGRLYLVWERYQTHQLIGWWVEQAKLVRAFYGVRAFTCDPSEPAYLRQFNMAGIPAIAALNDRKPGIQAVQTRLGVAGDGRARLFVMEGALVERDDELASARQPTCTEQEFDSLVWKKYADGRVNKEETVGPDHGLDAARYAVMWADLHTRRPVGRSSVPGAAGGSRLSDSAATRLPGWR